MKQHVTITPILLILLTLLSLSCSRNQFVIPLDGEWDLSLDSLFDPEVADLAQLEYTHIIGLPNTLDKAGIGKPISVDPELTTKVMRNLHRKVEYIGPAYYSRQINIPDNWEEKHISLAMERIIWESTIWIDGLKVGSGNSLSTPHIYDLSNFLTPGSHRITIRIDNRRQVNISKHDYAHAYTKETQTIWNGILGKFYLEARPRLHIGSVEIHPDFHTGEVAGNVGLSGQADGQTMLQWKVKDPDGNLVGSGKELACSSSVPFTLQSNAPVKGWNEHHPSLYTLETRLLDAEGDLLDTHRERFGFRNVRKEDGHIQINGQKIFLRGTLECCIFPLTGHPPLKGEEWKALLLKAREYGLNHLRFHSWCPPKAAFEAADELGFYFQVELPNWSLSYGEDPEVVRYMEKEASRILKSYGNHPSFLMFCMGNELMGDFKLINGLVRDLKESDPRHLYTATAFTFQEEHWGFHEPFDDFYVTQWTDSGWVRGQGVFDQEPPSFQHNYDRAIQHIEIPVISHEIGQYTVFPNLEEISKYTGVVTPVNLMAVRNDLEAKGRLEMAPTYTEASGKFATILYKEEIERAYKTAGLSGFQLLDLHDFPGQGTALVGMLDAFWESKGFTSGHTFSRFCSDLVPLLWYEKAVYTDKEIFRAEAGFSNYSGDLKDPVLRWKIRNSLGQVLADGIMDTGYIPNGKVVKLGQIAFPLDTVTTPDVLTIELKQEDSVHQNSWQIWVYPNDPGTYPGER